MKITKSRLRKIIRESLLSERKKLDIVTSKYEDTTSINALANHALNNDMQGALADPELQWHIDNNEVGGLVDDSYGWLKYVGNKDYGMYPAPEGWDLQKVYDFVKRFEDEAWRAFSQKEAGAHTSLPNKLEREIIGNALSQSYVMPDDIKNIEFQIRRKAGKPSNINIEDDHMVSNITAKEVERLGLTLDDIANVLRGNGAHERKKQKPVKHTPPMYD